MSFNKATRVCLVGVPRSQISQRAWPFQKNKVKSQLKQKLQAELWLYCLGISLFPWKIPVKTLQKRVSTLLSIFQFRLRSDGFVGETLVHAILFDTQLSPDSKRREKGKILFPEGSFPSNNAPICIRKPERPQKPKEPHNTVRGISTAVSQPWAEDPFCSSPSPARKWQGWPYLEQEI